MKNAIKLLALSFMLLGINAAYAQGREGMQKRKEIAEQKFKELSEKLHLSDDQKAKLREIGKQNRMEMKELHEAKKDAPKEERRTALIAQLKKTDEKISAVLDPKQKELYKQLKEEKRAERKSKIKERQEDKELIEDGLF